MGRTTLTLHRQGQFKAVLSGDNHCGVAPAGLFEPLTLKYDFRAVCKPTLDERGFLFEQLNVDKHFQTIRAIDVSCEELVVRVAGELIKLIKEEHPGCKLKRVTLMISASPHMADMTYDWKA